MTSISIDKISDSIGSLVDKIILSAFREIDACRFVKNDVKSDYPNEMSSQCINSEFDSKFFDDATQEWRSNKIKTGSFFRYVEPKKHSPSSIMCQYIHTKTGKQCSKLTEKFTAYRTSKHRFPTMLDAYQLNETKLSSVFCHQHRNRYKGIID